MRLLSWRPAIIIAAVVAILIVSFALVGTLGTGGQQDQTTVDKATSGTAPADQPATVEQRVSPLNRAGQVVAPYTVAAVGRGYCWTSSFVNGRLFRCMEGNKILDPCWKQPGRNSVACLPQPWSTRVVRVRLDRRLPPTDGSGPTLWGLRLGGVGVNCLVSMGASGMVAGKPVGFLCEHRWVLLGAAPDKSHPMWTMHTARWTGQHYRQHGSRPVTTSWVAVLR